MRLDHSAEVVSSQVPESQVVSGIEAPEESALKGWFSLARTEYPYAEPLDMVRVLVLVSGAPGVMGPKSIKTEEIVKENGIIDFMYWKPALTL